MTNVRFLSFSIACLLAVGLLAAGCGKPAGPPPGAPKSTDSPEVDLGSAEKDAGAEDAEKTTEAAPAGEKTAAEDEAGGWATLTGRIVYDGTPPEHETIEPTKDQEVCGKHEIPNETLQVSKDGGIKDAVIMLRTKNVEVAPSYEGKLGGDVVLDNKGCRFEPHVAIVLTSQKLELHNSDPIGHNSKVTPVLGAGINPLLPAGGEPVLHEFASAEAVPVPVGCNIHPWMSAFLIVRNDPYAAVTDADGKFTIKDLPAGKELEFGLWQESSGYLKDAVFKGGKANRRGRFKIKLKPGENDLGDIKVSPSIFKK